jgi:hypothetical protein
VAVALDDVVDDALPARALDGGDVDAALGLRFPEPIKPMSRGEA